MLASNLVTINVFITQNIPYKITTVHIAGLEWNFSLSQDTVENLEVIFM